MDKIIVIKNGLVQTFDEESNTGYYNLVLKNDKIFHIDFDNELNKDSFIISKFPGAHIIDAKDKLILPSFINSYLNSTQTLNHFFLNSCTYSNLNDNISLNLIEKHFINIENKISFKNLVAYTYFRSLFNGETSILDFSRLISKEFLVENFNYNFLSSQDVVFNTYDNELNQFLDEHRIFHFICVNKEEDINNYSLNSFKRLLNSGNKKLAFEVLQKPDSNELFRKAFSKSLINVLKENDLLSSKTIFVNPVYVNTEEIENFGKNHVNVIMCPSDLLRLAERHIDIEEFFQDNVNVSLGMGLTGYDMLSEVKTFNGMIKKIGINYEFILRLITTNASKTIDKENFIGSVKEGKLANLIFFDLSKIDNMLNVPEVDSERISEFIIENLTVKDISDVITKGTFVKRNYLCKFFDPEMLRQIHQSLVKQVYETGKYFEFKENFLRRKRIKELARRTSETKDTIFRGADNSTEEDFILNENEIISDSEFRIIGLYKTDKSFSPEEDFNRVMTIKELESLDCGLKLFDEDERDYSKLETVESSSKKYPEIKSQNRSNTVVTPDDSQDSKGPEKDNNKNVTFKKEKLRFGFADDDS